MAEDVATPTDEEQYFKWLNVLDTLDRELYEAQQHVLEIQRQRSHAAGFVVTFYQRMKGSKSEDQ